MPMGIIALPYTTLPNQRPPVQPMATLTERSHRNPPNLDAPHGRAHSAGMVVPFDTLAATEAMESVGVDPRHARVIAAQLWRLFGGIVAVAGLAVSAIKYLP